MADAVGVERADRDRPGSRGETVRLPTFIMIGAAKAGTTALYWYLAEHPQVFMSRLKETNYFAYGVGGDGRLLYGDPELHSFPVRTIDEYEALFAGAAEARAVGEISPIYLESPHTAGRIHETLPQADILGVIRHPVDRAYSDYQMYLRSRGRRLEPGRDLTVSSAWAQPNSHWMRIGRYHEALSRYFAVYPRERVHVLLFDDLRRDPIGFVQELYRCVGVDTGFVPDLDTPHNVGGVPASMLVERLLMSKRIKAAIEPWVPKPVADLARHVRTRNLRRAPALPAGVRSELIEHFREDILKTSDLIGRSLAHWLEPRPA